MFVGWKSRNWQIEIGRGECLLDGNHGIGKSGLEEVSVCRMKINELANQGWIK